jgi:pimeloyl-ACP methyl ester carboxylesterase
MKGYGRSDRVDPNYEWQQTDDLMNSLGITKYFVVSHDWGTIIGSVMVSDHTDHILGFVWMEADLIRDPNASRIAGYLQKPQWLTFQNHWFGVRFMEDAGWFLDLVYGLRLSTISE